MRLQDVPMDSRTFFQVLIKAGPASRIRGMISCSSPHAGDWLKVIPNPNLNNLDVVGFHAMVCAAGKWRIAGHDQIRDIIFDWLRKGFFNPTKEAEHLVSGTSGRRLCSNSFFPCKINT